MADILILVGTESGNAEMVATALKEDLTARGHGVEVLSAFEDPVAFSDRAHVLICCATHGLGELPDNIIPLSDALTAAPQDLSHLRYGVIALGDQTYEETFCNGGKTMDALFAKMGAERVGERLEIDACTQPLPDEEALEWAREWVTLL